MAYCSVQGCPEEAGHSRFSVSSEDAPIVEFAVCDFHLQALQSGEPFVASADGKDILIGEDRPADLIGWERHDTIAGRPRYVLILGRDGIETSRVSFHLTKDQARLLEMIAVD